MVLLFFIGVSIIVLSYSIISLVPITIPFGSNITFLLLLSLPAVLTTNIYQGFRSILFALYRERYGELLKISRKLLYPLLAILFIFLGYDVAGVIYALIISSLFASTLGYYYTRNRINFNIKNFVGGYQNSGREITSYGSLLLFSMLFTQIHYQADILLVSYFEGGTPTGVYKGVLVIAQFLWIGPKAIQQTMLHNVSNMYSNDNLDQIESIVSKLMDYTLILLILLGIGLGVLADPLLTVYYGTGFESGVLPLQILIFGVVVRGLARITNPVLEGAGLLRYSVIASVVASVMNIVLNVILIPKMGIVGAATATSVSYSSLLIFYSFFTKSELGIWPYDSKLWVKVAFGGLVTAIIIGLLEEAIRSALANLFVVSTTGLIIYSVLLLKLGAINTHEIYDLWDRAPLSNIIICNKIFYSLRPLLLKIECGE